MIVIEWTDFEDELILRFSPWGLDIDVGLGDEGRNELICIGGRPWWCRGSG